MKKNESKSNINFQNNCLELGGNFTGPDQEQI